MTVKTLTRKQAQTKVFVALTQECQGWLNEYISIPDRAWVKDEDTGYPAVIVDREFCNEIIEEIIQSEDLSEGIDYKVKEV